VTIITPSWIFLRVTKTGSETIQTLLRRLCAEGHLPYNSEEISFRTTDKGSQKERFSQLDPAEQARFIFGSIRNPWAWYYSFWNWYHAPRMQEFLGKDHRIIPTNISFEDWVKANPGKLVEEMQIHYPADLRLVRVENLTEELVAVLEEAGESISETGINLIRNWPDKNVNKKRTLPYKSFYTGGMKELVLRGVAPVFDAYYPDRSFPEEK